MRAPGERASRDATWTRRSARCSAATAWTRTPRLCGSPRRLCGRRATPRGWWRPGAAATPMRSSPQTMTRYCSPTAPRGTTLRMSWSPRTPSLRCCGCAKRRSGWPEMLKLRRGVVSATDPPAVRVGKEERPAWVDRGLVGDLRVGDEVIVNVEARDLGLGSGGFDVVHVNLTRGLEAPGAGEAVAMKLNYSSLQHPVE